MLTNFAYGVGITVAWLLCGWLTLVFVMAVLDQKPKDSDDRGLCGLALVLWPVTIAIIVLGIIIYCFVEGINQLVKSAVAPSDAVARVAAKAWRYPQQKLVLPAKIRNAEVRDATKELDAFLKHES